MIKEMLARVVERKDLTGQEMSTVMDEIMKGEATPAQIAGFITALRMKGETVIEVSGAAASMRRHAVYINAGARSVVDTCGTGGDGAHTFNISTAAAFVTAGAGVCVAKHGNRAVSSKCGSADVLAALGVNIEAESAVMEQCLQEHGIGFLFAPKMHPAMKHAIGPRRELGVRTIFNMLGPLTNPAGATGQVLGVFAPDLTEMFAGALKELGTRRAFVVHGSDGLDEITCTGTTRVSELRDGVVKTYEISAEMLLGDTFRREDLAGGTPAENAELLRKVLSGEEKGAPRAVVLLNAAAAIVAGETADTMEEGLDLARQAIDSGGATAKLNALIDATR
ncbi:MAG: anthranilate phosphoribosyltransferase [Lentisphaerae bacterium RIFOXYB12_FULL_65_16]|nr:MAG: anthranilate phosphoribosyltransferase [Lentisphaerae bacterium RIFOXYA12_64_32]OGV87144.1 MAG: anthranilate phosphoribosyltransferase [Lentisphaerae bacterium RIFOXYB12_FULL_65_16]